MCKYRASYIVKGNLFIQEDFILMNLTGIKAAFN